MAVVVPFALVAAAGVLRRSDLSGALVTGADGTAGRGELILQEFLALVQVATSLALVIGAGLLLRNAVPPTAAVSSGEERGNRLMFQIDIPQSGEPDAATLSRAYGAVLDDVAALVGHPSVSLATPGARLGVGSLVFVTAQCGRCSIGGVYVPQMPGYVRLHAVSPDFFAASGVRVLEGREFTAGDSIGSSRVMLVNRAFSASHFEGGRPLGRKVQIGGVEDPWHTVVGIVAEIDGRGIGPAVRSEPVAYVPILQEPTLRAGLAVAAPTDSRSLAGAIVEAIARGSGTGSVSAITSMTDYLARRMAPVRWLAIVFALVGIVVFMLGVFGTYTVMRFKVTRHWREIGMRRALGATRRRIVGLVVLQSSVLALLGAALGAWTGLLFAGWLDTLVPGLEALDLPVYGLAVVSLSLAALAGGSISARQAATVDPAVAIGSE
jgi:putative ABC transport system permease protein